MSKLDRAPAPSAPGPCTLAGQTAHFAVEIKELREKIQPDIDEDFVASVGSFGSVEELRADIKRRLEENALDRARHGFADRIIEYAVANATVELPDVLKRLGSAYETDLYYLVYSDKIFRIVRN